MVAARIDAAAAEFVVAVSEDAAAGGAEPAGIDAVEEADSGVVDSEDATTEEPAVEGRAGVGTGGGSVVAARIGAEDAAAEGAVAEPAGIDAESVGGRV